MMHIDGNSIYKTSTMKPVHSEIQNQLTDAHSTVFDAELFSDASIFNLFVLNCTTKFYSSF